MARARARWALLSGLLVLLVLAPRFLGGYALSVLILCCLWAALAMSWDFMSGQTGRENFGHGMFIGAGAYAAAFFNLNPGASPLPCVLAAAGSPATPPPLSRLPPLPPHTPSSPPSTPS